MTRFLKIIMIGLAALSLIGGASAIAAENLVVNGSTTVLPIGQATAEAYMKKAPNVNISISGGGSGNGIKSLIDKTTQIAMSSREMKKEEIELAKSKSVNPVEHKVAIDALTPVVHPSNPVANLTIEQLSLIYQGKIRNWKEVGGKDLQIVVISRDTSSGTYESWQEKVLHKEKVTPRAQLQASSGAVVQAVSKNRVAVG
jgi:phosphate transport system substrate-binding protein